MAGGVVSCQHVFDGTAHAMKSEGIFRTIGLGRKTTELPLRVCVDCDFVLEMYPG